MSALSYLDDALARVHPHWLPTLQAPALADTLAAIDRELTRRAAEGAAIFPPRSEIFHALRYCPPEKIRAVILGQDPYHGAGEAMGLSFSVPEGVRLPPSLRNIFKEIGRELGLPQPHSGDLTPWARQGVLLLNSVLTVEADRAGSHGKLGWQSVSDALIDRVNRDSQGCVFMLWGNWARTKAERIDPRRHLVLEAAHPSPLSASRGFFGCDHFAEATRWLRERDLPPIDWSTGQPAPTLS